MSKLDEAFKTIAAEIGAIDSPVLRRDANNLLEIIRGVFGVIEDPESDRSVLGPTSGSGPSSRPTVKCPNCSYQITLS